MAWRTFETEDMIYKYSVDGRKPAYSFTDLDGKEVTINHLWFYDPELVSKVTNGTMMYQDIISWVHRHLEDMNEACLRVDPQLHFLFFDHLHHSSNFGGYGNYKVPSYDDRPDLEQSFILADVPNSNRVEKPTLVMNDFGYNGKCFDSPTSVGTPNVVTTQWNRINNYSFKMNQEDFGFFRKTERDSPYNPMFGLELELSTQLSTVEIDYIVQKVEPKQEPFFIFKQDSSVSGRYRYKIELVTVPCTMRYLKRAWKTFFTKIGHLCKEKGLSVADVFDCAKNLNNGIHIHVSKDSFSSSFHERKFITIFNQWDNSTVDFLTGISGRPTKYTDNSYCAIDGSYLGYTLARRLKNRSAAGRSACHNRNSNTVEVRIYQGIFDLQHLIRCIEMTHAIHEFSDGCSIKSFGLSFTQSFKSFVTKSVGYRTLKEYLKCA